MKCFPFFHRWSPWENFRVRIPRVYPGHGFLVSKPVKVIEDRRRRRCERCGKWQVEVTKGEWAI